jgi:hypothetical protein
MRSSRSFQTPEQTGSVIVELPEGRAEIARGERAARMPSAGAFRKSTELEFAASFANALVIREHFIKQWERTP